MLLAPMARMHKQKCTNLVLMGHFYDVRVIINLSVGVGVLDENSTHVIRKLKLAALLNYNLHP